MNRIEKLKTVARRLGYWIRPISPQMRQTVELVADGYDTRSKLAARLGIKPTTATMRLQAARDQGYLGCEAGFGPVADTYYVKEIIHEA